MFTNKKDEIIYAAGKLMRQKGFDATTMMDIANEVGMLKGSLYHHFSSKEEIFFSVIHKGINKLYSSGKTIFESDLTPPEKLKKLVEVHVLHLMNKNDAIAVFAHERNKSVLEHEQSKEYIKKRDSYENFLREILKTGVNKGYFPKEINIKLTSLSILGMMNWSIQWYRPDGSFTAEEIANYMSFLVCNLMLKVK